MESSRYIGMLRVMCDGLSAWDARWQLTTGENRCSAEVCFPVGEHLTINNSPEKKTSSRREPSLPSGLDVGPGVSICDLFVLRAAQKTNSGHDHVLADLEDNAEKVGWRVGTKPCHSSKYTHRVDRPQLRMARHTDFFYFTVV